MIDNLILWKCFLEGCTKYVHLESGRKMFTILFTNIKVWSLRTFEIEFLDRFEEHKQNMYRNSQKKHKRTHLKHTHTCPLGNWGRCVLRYWWCVSETDNWFVYHRFIRQPLSIRKSINLAIYQLPRRHFNP